MKRFYIILLTLCVAMGSSYSWQPSPKHTFFAFDIDDVIAKPSYFQKLSLVLGGIWLQPLNSHHWLSSLFCIKNRYKKDANGKREALLDDEGNSVNGLFFHFLYHATRDLNLAHYVPFVVNTIESSRTPIHGTVEICHYLKNQKGYTIVFATNKDRPSYDVFAKNIGTDVTSIADNVFVAHPGNNEAFLNKIRAFIQRDDIPVQHKKFTCHALQIQPTQHIRHVPSTKPHTQYYEYVHKTTQKEHNKQHMIFIDDKQTNIDGVHQYNKDTDEKTHIVGITFKNPYLLAKELVKLGVLSKQQDKTFLQKMKQYK